MSAKIKIAARQTDAQIYEALSQAGVPDLLARLYSARGLKSTAEADCDLARLHSPAQLMNADRMARILADAIEAGKKLMIVADYDSDGATACAIGMRALRMFGADVQYIVPNRFEYGYGLSPEIVRVAHGYKPDYIITVDNGISNVDGVAVANELGMQVLVTDHHLAPDALPDAACIVNPNQPGCPFPSKNIAGCGVIFYVMLALRAEFRARGAYKDRKDEPNLTSLLDLVALGTIADVVKLDQNNRILVDRGLKQIRAGMTCQGIQALLRVSGKNIRRVTSQDLGFSLGPRLNAAGRLDEMTKGIECLITDDPQTALKLASELHAINMQRREIEGEMKEQALAIMERMEVKGTDSITLYHPDWHQGVIGIVASRIKELYNRPVIVFAPDKDGMIKGSGRSIPGFHLRDALVAVADMAPGMLVKFGGHAMAAGLSIKEADLERFGECLEKVAAATLTPAMRDRVIETDGELPPEAICLDNALLLEQGVWGQGFAPPTFLGEFDVQHQRVVGDKHTRLRLACGDQVAQGILFFHNDPLPARIRAVYCMEPNEFQGNISLQLRLEHWEPVNETDPLAVPKADAAQLAPAS